MFNIPEDEITETFVRSGGKGGQNVNKVNTKVCLKWNLYQTRVFIFEEIALIAYELRNRINDQGELTITCEGRSQSENRKLARQKLYQLVSKALEPREERKPTKPTRGSKEKRLKNKKKNSDKKKNRKKLED